MKIPFRQHHLFQILHLYDPDKGALDSFLRSYFRKNKAVGSKDRKEITETIYHMFRWRALLDYHCRGNKNWENRYEVFKNFNYKEHLDNENIPLHIRLSFPKKIFNLLLDAYGEKKAIQISLASNSAAPTTIRPNPLKTTRNALLKKWAHQYAVTPCNVSPLGITFHKRENFFAMPEFKEGLFEIQDEGSQLLADLVHAKPKDSILDYCAGSGGKTLAFAHKLKGTGQIYLHDIRSHALLEAKKRLRRAGIQNIQFVEAKSKQLKKLKGKMSWVFVDTPCSGSGTMRRNPDIKWNFNHTILKRLIDQQREIFASALDFLHPKGKIIYATCSLFPQENEEQVKYFLEQFPLALRGDIFKTEPQEGSMDGFFGAVFKMK